MGKRKGLRKEDILNVARRMFLENGYEKTAIRDILAGLEIKIESPRAYYVHFESKEEIYAKVVKNYAESMEKTITACIDQSPGELGITDKFIQYFMGLISFFYECHALSGPSIPNSSDFNASVAAYIADKCEDVLSTLLQEAPWDQGKSGAKVLAKMAAGGILRTSQYILEHNRREPLTAPIYRLALELVERIMDTCRFPEEYRAPITERLEKETENMLKENSLYPAQCVGKEFTADSLKACIRRLSWSADIVRAVDPGPCRVLLLGEEGKVTVGDRCHGFWYRDDRCGDCVSKDCMRDNLCHEKDEELDGYAFHIISIPITLKRDDGTMMRCAIESIQVGE